jgi:spermidine dehydrogenase
MDDKIGGEKKDRELGMAREITRRDFLNGVALGTGAALLGGSIGAEQLFAAAAFDEFAPEKAPDYYPPSRTGIRGNHDGSFTFAHRMRDGEAASSLGDAIATGESYDLVIVGGGISGLAAAYRFRQKAGKSAKILILTTTMILAGTPSATSFRLADEWCCPTAGRSRLRAPAVTARKRRRC